MTDRETSDGAPAPATLPGKPVTATAAALSDGEWHRLHPASPLLKGGIALIAIIGVIIANLRERLVEIFVPQAGYGESGDPIDLIVENGFIGYAALAVLVLLIVLVLAFYISWRMHTFRITAEVVEVRSGVVFRTNRKARLDRIQGINIQRSLIPRLFGAAKLEVSQAGQDANVKLDYLSSSAADDLRREILRLASGTREAASAPAHGGRDGQSVVERRVDEFLAPELDPDAAEPESVVKLSVGRLLGSIALSGTTVFVVLAIIVVVVVSIAAPRALFGLFALIPMAIGVVSYSVQKFTKSLRYSIAGTPDGVRVGFGLLSTSNETLPPGRIHSVRVSQSLLWRPFDWWEIKVNRASHSSTSGAAGQQNTTILPVGNLSDVTRVLGLVLPSLLDERAISIAEQGLTASGGPDDGFVNSPRRARGIRWFSWRRNGFAITSSATLLRKGAIWRELIVVPHPRVQSVSTSQGPLLRAMRLSSVHLDTVAGPITAQLGAVDLDAALGFVEEVEAAAVSASNRDASHRWRSSDGAAVPVGGSADAVFAGAGSTVAVAGDAAAPVADPTDPRDAAAVPVTTVAEGAPAGSGDGAADSDARPRDAAAPSGSGGSAAEPDAGPRDAPGPAGPAGGRHAATPAGDEPRA